MAGISTNDDPCGRTPDPNPSPEPSDNVSQDHHGASQTNKPISKTTEPQDPGVLLEAFKNGLKIPPTLSLCGERGSDNTFDTPAREVASSRIDTHALRFERELPKTYTHGPTYLPGGDMSNRKTRILQIVENWDENFETAKTGETGLPRMTIGDDLEPDSSKEDAIFIDLS